jgi:hypothetical protein
MGVRSPQLKASEEFHFWLVCVCLFTILKPTVHKFLESHGQVPENTDAYQLHKGYFSHSLSLLRLR